MAVSHYCFGSQYDRRNILWKRSIGPSNDLENATKLVKRWTSSRQVWIELIKVPDRMNTYWRSHPVQGTISPVHAHTKHFYCASSKKLLKISEPMISATQMVWKYFCWMCSQLHPFLVVMTAIYYFYRPDKTKKRDWKEVLQNRRILLWNENKRAHTLKLSFLSSIRLCWETRIIELNGFSIKRS